MANNNEIDDWVDVPVEAAGVDDWQDVEEGPSELESAGQGIGQGISFGLSDEVYGARKALQDTLFGDAKFIDIADTYRSNRDDARESLAGHQEVNPKSYMAGEVGGGLATALVPGLNAAKGASLSTQASKMAAQGAAEGYGRSDADTALEQLSDTAVGGTIGAILPQAMNKSGKAYAAGKRLLPGTENALPQINKGVAKVAQFVPGADYKAKELSDIMDDTVNRRAGRELNETENRAKLSESMSKLLSETQEFGQMTVNDIYKSGQDKFLKELNPNDFKKLNTNPLETLAQKAEMAPEQFGKGGKITANAMTIIQRGGADDIARNTFGEAVEEGTLDAAQVKAGRYLQARRYLDDVTKSKNWENMLRGERELILDFRGEISKQLRGLSSGNQLTEVDQLFAEYAATSKNALNKIETPTPAGVREITPEKMEMFLKSQSSQAKYIDRAFGEFSNTLGKIERKEGGILRSVADHIKQVRSVFGKINALEGLKRSSGGPTSQAVNVLLQAGGGIATGGWSLLALPITNPAGWLKIVDSSAPIEKKFLEKISTASRELLRRYPRAASQLYILSKKDNESGE